MAKEEINSFDPIIPSKPKVLILGSMPGVESLKLQQYYGHPQNAFWYAIASLQSETNPPKTYKERIQLLLDNNIALWDVCKYCQRKGSLDSEIKNAKPNEIHKLLVEHPTITTVLFNGQPPNKLYRKFFKPLPFIQYKVMPSTSPTYATMRRSDKVEFWKKELFVFYYLFSYLL